MADNHSEIVALMRANASLEDASLALDGIVSRGTLAPGDMEHAKALAAQLHEESQRFAEAAYSALQGERENADNETPDNDVEQPRPLQIQHLVYDQRQVQDRGSQAIKWYNPFTELGDRTGSTRRTLKKGICVHHTAVKGGFGTHESRREYWFNQTLRSTANVPQPNGESAKTEWLVWNDEAFKDHAHWAECMALADRYRGYMPGEYNTGVPYQAIRAASGFVVLNLPFDWVTWHGDGANTDFLGFAWDGDSRYEEPQAEDLYEDLKYVLELARAEGHPIEELTGHCAWTRKPDDPGKPTVEAMAQLASEESLTINWDFKVSGGRSLREVLDGE